MVIARKKLCKRCGRNLWRRKYFYHTKAGWCSTYCKDCMRELKREEYARNRKVPDGVRKNFETGQLIDHQGASRRIFWTEYMIERLRRGFPRVKNEDLALDLNVSPRTMIRKARELGLEKDPNWMREHSRANCRVMRVLNKCRGNSGQWKKGQHANPAGEFKKKTTTSN